MVSSTDAMKANMALVQLYKDGLIKSDSDIFEVRIDTDEIAKRYPSNPQLFLDVLQKTVAGLEVQGYSITKRLVNPEEKIELPSVADAPYADDAGDLGHVDIKRIMEQGMIGIKDRPYINICRKLEVRDEEPSER